MDNYNSKCGCGNNRNGCRDLGMKLSMIGFALHETVLYLDVYPDSAPALEYYHRLHEQYEQALYEYESKCGPLTAMGNKSHSTWQWISMPWPWEYDAN